MADHCLVTLTQVCAFAPERHHRSVCSSAFERGLPALKLIEVNWWMMRVVRFMLRGFQFLLTLAGVGLGNNHGVRDGAFMSELGVNPEQHPTPLHLPLVP